MDTSRTIEWSPETYTVNELARHFKTPVIALVKQGHCSLREEDSISQGQVIRIARIHSQNRVIARDAKNREISIPLDLPLQFEVLPNKSASIRGTFRKLKRMRLTELVRNYQLPHKVRLPAHLHTDPIVENLVGIDLISGPIDLNRIEEEGYLQGNAVNFGELDTTVLNVPDHSDLEVSVALGARSGRQAQFKKLENKLADRVAKAVRFGDAVGTKEIKRLVQIGAEDSTRPERSASTISGVSTYHEKLASHHTPTLNGVASGKYQKKNTGNNHPSLSTVEMRMVSENNSAPVTNENAVFHFDNAAFDNTGLSDSDELEPEDPMSDNPEPEVWTDVRLDDDDDDDVAPPKELFNAVSDFSFHNPRTWGFGNRKI